jgi:hypothetical protein
MRLLILTIVILLATASSTYGLDDRVRFVIDEVQPNVIPTGYQGPLNITIQNVGFETGYRINGELTSITSPLTIIGDTKQYLDLRTQPCADLRICNLISAGDLATFTFDLSIADDAYTGIYYSTLTVGWLDGTTTESTGLNFGIEIVGSPNLIVSGTSTNPSVVYPDTEFNMAISVENIGSDSAKSVELQLTPLEGFTGERTVQLGTVDIRSLIEELLTQGNLNQTGSQAGALLNTALFSLKAEEGVTLGHHELKAQLSYKDSKGNDYSKIELIDVFIQDRGQAKLSISGINTSPSKVYPNTDFTITITMENTGSQAAKATKLDLQIPKEFTGEDSAFLGSIEEDQTSSASLDMKAIKTASPGVYTIESKSVYTDEQGRDQTTEEPFNVFVLDRGEVILEISGKSTSPTVLMPGTDFTLSIQLENIGEQDAKSVRMELETNGDLKGELTSFVGEIEKDDVATGVFDLLVLPSAEPGQKMASARVIYIDEQGVENTIIKTFDIFIGEPAGRSTTTIVAVVVIVLVLVVYLWRRRKSEFAEA